MAVFKSLTFDGINSLDYGIYVTGEAVYNAPERVVEMVEIPGRNGSLAIDQGRFTNIEVSYPCGCFADTQAEFAEKVSAFRNAIASRYSYKRLTDEYNADEYRLGLYKSGLEVSAVRYGTAGQFTITFDCKPQRFLLDGDAELSPTDYSDVYTVSGDIVQIENDGSLGVKSLTADIEPIQSLNGYDKPWSGGAGKNKLNNRGTTQTINGVTFTVNSDGTVKANGTATARTVFTLREYGVFPSGDYILSGGVNSNATIELSVYGSPTRYPNSSGGDTPFTVGENVNVWGYIVIANGTTVSNVLFKPMIRLSSVSDATYEPYENICPISGHTEVVTQRTGKNLFNEQYPNIDGSMRRVYVQTGNGTFTLSTTTQAVDGSANLFFQAGQATSGESTGGNGVYSGKPRTVTTTDGYVTISYRLVNNTTDAGNPTKCKTQLENGSTPTTYEPYNGNTYTTDLGRTVYGGTLDVVSGVLTDKMAMADLGTFTWQKYGTYSNMDRYVSAGIDSTAKDGETNAICSIYPLKWGANGFVIGGGSVKLSVLTELGQYSSVADFKTAMNGVQLCYELSTPQTYQLTPQEVELLLGTNNLWTDCGDSTVEYGIPPYYNPTEFDAKPLIKVTGRGTLGIGEYILTITGTVTQTLYIDCETMEIYTLEGTVPTGASSLVSINKTDFPVLKPGHNGVSVGTGLSALTITPRWWRI